jgi:hypothetical protein
MKTPLSAIANELKLALEAGVIDLQEIVRWADGLLMSEEYDDRIAEISMSRNKTNKDLEALLGEISAPDDDFAGFRGMLGRMHDALEAQPARLHDFTRFLERLWIRHDYTLPDDLGFIIGLEDDYLLAVEGQYGSVSAILTQLLDDLARFRSPNTEPDSGGHGSKQQ